VINPRRSSPGSRSATYCCSTAASIAALCFTTEAVVADKPEKNPASAGGDPPGGMDF
jgi:hypothetical protein